MAFSVGEKVYYNYHKTKRPEYLGVVEAVNTNDWSRRYMVRWVGIGAPAHYSERSLVSAENGLERAMKRVK